MRTADYFTSDQRLGVGSQGRTPPHFVMENYFNYFTEIEEYFQKKRGELRLLSPIDWALIESLQQAGIPLEAAFRGIDQAFEKKSKRKASSRKINSLSYCLQPILEEFERQKDASQGSANQPTVPPQVDNTDRENLKALLEKAHKKLQAANLRPEFQRSPVLTALLPALLSTLENIFQTVASLPTIDYESLDLQLNMMEEKLIASLQTSLSDEELLALRKQVNGELSQHRRGLKAEHLALLEKKMLNKYLLERYGLPRLNLFYLPIN